jgi:hypothetical protein
MKRISALLGGAVLGVAVLAACGGGGGTGSSLPAGPPAPAGTTAPPAGNSTQSFNVSDAVAIPSPAPGATSVPVPLPSDPNGASANAAFPANGVVPPDTTVAATYSTTADATMPTLSKGRKTLSRGTRDDNSGNGTKPIAYLRLQFSADVTLPVAPAFSFVVPGTFTTNNGVTYWLALYDPTHVAAGWQKAFEGPATLTPQQTPGGNAATKFDFASNGKPITFVANQTYYLVLLAIGPATATPTPAPSSVPSNPPPDAKPSPVTATPTNLQFDSVNASPQMVTFSEQGFTGLFVLHGSCTGIVNTSGASPTWTLTPVGLGRCYVVGLGDKGASAVVRVNVGPPETPHPTTPPTTSPSQSPEPTHPPTTAPTTSPSHSPEPTDAPTTSPSHSPEPTHPPTTAPSTTPKPTTAPTTAPTTSPSHSPEPTPSPKPSVTPTAAPTQNPNPSPTPTPTPGSTQK